MGAEDDIPAEVQAEVDKIKAEEVGTDERTEEVQLEHVEVEPRKSRKQQAEEERAAQFRAVEERATKAEQLAQEIRNEANARMARLEGLLEAGRQQPQYVEPQQQPRGQGKDWREKYDKERKKADKALAENDLAGYHEHNERAMEIKMEAKFNPRLEETTRNIQQQLPQQQFQKPPWVTSVENEFPDVVQNAAGLNAVAAFINLDSTPGFSPEKLKRAFLRARQELTPAQQQAGTSQPTDRARAVLSGSPVGGGGRSAPSGAGGKAKVQVPKNYESIARAAGMSPEDYKRAALAMERGK
jgi:hypothetical protein